VTPRPLRILVAHNVPRARTGGMSRLMGFIHDRVVQAGHRVDYFCSEDVPRQLNGRWARFTFPALVWRHTRAAARRGEPYDLVNVHEPSGAALVLDKRTTGKPVVVVTSHGVERRAWELALEDVRLGRDGPGWKSRLVFPLTRLWQADLSLRRADHIFCLNDQDRDYLAARYGIPHRQVTRIFPAADAAYAAAAADRDYTRAARLLFAATWRKNKGIEDLVPAFVTLAARHPSLELTVLGAGVPHETVWAAFPEAIRHRIRCIQTRTEAETAAAFAEADLFVLPSLFEGTPLTLMEAMASGLPTVTTATAGMKDVIRDGATGLLVPIRSPEAIAAALERLLQGPTVRASLGHAARTEALRRYTWGQVAVPVLEAYQKLCRNL